MLHIFPLLIERVKKWDLFLFPFIIISVFFILIPTALIFYFAFGLSGGAELSNQLELLDKTLFICILNSFFIALWTTFISLIIGIPLAYFIFRFKNKFIKSIITFLIIVPLWSNYLIKLIGLKTVFDYFYGYENSTYGVVYTIIGLTYIFLPITVINIYNTLRNISSNIILSSSDLGYNEFETCRKIVIPYLKPTLFSAVSLVFFPSVFSVAVNDFLNNDNSTQMIAQRLMSLTSGGISDDYTKSILFFLVFVIIFMLVTSVLVIRGFLKLFRKFKNAN